VTVAVVTGGSGGVGRAVVRELEARGWEVVSWSRRDGIDVGDEAQVERAAARLGRWDALVNNAAVLIPRLLTELSAADWDETLRAGLRGPFLCSRAAFRRMGAGGAAAKSGLAGLTEALAVEGRPLGIRVNAVSPGSIATPMLALSGAPRDPALRPDEVARVIAWLAGPESAPLSGANLRLDP